MEKSQAKLGIIGGTGLNALFADGFETLNIETPYGKLSSHLSVSTINGVPVAFLPRHGSPHHIPPHKINYRANIWALRQAGIERIVAVNAVGGISPNMVTGALVVPDQLIDYTWDREHTYFDGEAESGLEHFDFSYPFDASLREALQQAAAGLTGVELVPGGTYGVTQGPRLETAAEINRMARDGCDVVGMTAMPEAGLARELEMAYASLCLVVNPAAGRSDTEITMEDINRVVEQGMRRVRDVLSGAVQLI